MKIAIHMLTPYPPSNPNRDELGMPKTATVGGDLRQRISSQALKRAWRFSDEFRELEAATSTRTRAVGEKVRDRMVERGCEKGLADKVGKSVSVVFGKADKSKPLRTSEVVILGREEWDAAMELADTCTTETREASDDELDGLQRSTTSIDVAMFGRMRAAKPLFNVDAAVSVAHGLTTNRTSIEADFWTAVDDLNSHEDDAGAGGMGEREFGSGVYYVYAIVDRDRLVENLDSNIELASDAICALISAMATSTPGGHRSSFAHHSCAAYMGVEKADRVCGNLMLPAFETPVARTEEAIEQLRQAQKNLSTVYGFAPFTAELCAHEGTGSIAGIIDIIKAD